MIDFTPRDRENPAMRPHDTAYDKKAIGVRIVAVREALDMTPAAFARHTGLSPQAISNWECGLRRISLDKAIRLCRATGATLDWIYFGDASGLPIRFAKLARKFA